MAMGKAYLLAEALHSTTKLRNGFHHYKQWVRPYVEQPQHLQGLPPHRPIGTGDPERDDEPICYGRCGVVSSGASDEPLGDRAEDLDQRQSSH